MPATYAVIDFTKDPEFPDPILTGSREPVSYGSKGGIMGRPISSTDKKQIRKRARRKMKIASDEIRLLYSDRPVEEWDMEELAKGRPRAADGTFKGRSPSYLDRTLHEQIIKRFETIVKEEMNTQTVDALNVISAILKDDTVDIKGKFRTPVGTKLDAAKFLIEHVIGKPKQRTETDISVKLQGILGHAIVNPTASGDYALTSGYVEAASWEDDDDDLDEG